MTIYESELILVKKRLEDINNERSRPGDKNIVIAAGDPVVDTFRDEYIALKRMKEILENNFQQNEDYEYINARKVTKLPKLIEGMEERLIHSISQTDEQSFSPAPAPAPAPAPQGHKMTTEEIQQLLQGNLSSEQPPAPEPVESGKLTQEEIERLMNEAAKKDQERVQQTIPEPAPEPAPVREQASTPQPEPTQTSGWPSASEIENIIGGGTPGANPTPPVQQQDNLIYLTSEQLESLVKDAVTKALAQLNLGAQMQGSAAPQPEPAPTEPHLNGGEQEPPAPVPPEPVEQMPDLTEEEQAAMAQAILHGEPEHTDDDDDLEPIVKVTKWQWIKNHKKPILIALGITAMALTVALGLHNILPALKVIDNSQALANLGGQMLENSKLASLGVDQLSLHSANTALAEQITEMSSIKHTFDAATGSWTFGTKGLQEFITAQSLKAAEAKEAVSAIKAAMAAGGLTGLGLFGTGLIMPRAKSQEFKDIAKEIKEYPKNIEFTTNDDLDAKHSALENKIQASTTLKDWEKKKLLKKLKKSQKKVDHEIQYRDDPNFEAGMALGETLSEPEGRSL